MATVDGLLLPLMMWLAICLRYGTLKSPNIVEIMSYSVLSILALPLFLRAGLYRAITRYLAEKVVLVIVSTTSLVMLSYAGIVIFLNDVAWPKTTFLIAWLLMVFYMLASRFGARFVLRHFVRAPLQKSVLIYGAGSAGRQLATALANGFEYQPIGFLDDDKRLHKLEIGGLKVFLPSELASLIKRKNIKQVLLALPSASKNRRVELINWLEPFHVDVRVVPGMADLVSGLATVSDVRTVDVDELLGREAVPPDQELLAGNIRGKVVMVTGAGGSIGSELCRQIIQQDPVRVVLYEMSEFALYSIDQELRHLLPETAIELVPVLGSVQDGQRIGAIMQRYSVQTVYHAAAYKHVPIVEFNITEGVLNNTFGTLATALAAQKQNVETFVLVSTDKAVRPTNVMGATKRVAELVLQALADMNSGSTRFCMVRFGNVLGSSGSVVPLFRKQLEMGGPITVTHPEITRYFMTIPEAAQLVIQAGAMGNSGEVFVLDMGQPVKIVDLARRMIHLSGYTIKDSDQPDGEIEIQYAGLRPGEKLYEELLIGSNVLGTSHPKIMKAKEEFLTKKEMDSLLADLLYACNENDLEAIMALLHRCVVDFKPEATIKDHLYDY
ncbi:polysaccharide biosynthesis protein [Chitinimonas sp. BJB300]|uniref:polysaccharide biosynthesis protein n=1 Tax=Chitinimonas sp. BJB300 TaxID=1559339 RepID=UPI000C0ED6E9|nr:nucleoside-diphosphate sugar epimerase/dehydratase [Chitinimonas sp. BJB300]PHV11164.1 polysaccharide biosynthesis protein [Chitinimonas sp. BJB300]TSJ85557.1 polysaccharide biosynthesis protein [Chitinimonas sp. BJB300]